MAKLTNEKSGISQHPFARMGNLLVNIFNKRRPNLSGYSFLGKILGSSYKNTPDFCSYLQLSGKFETEEDVVKNFDTLVCELYDWLDAKDYKLAHLIMKLTLDKNNKKTRDDRKTPKALHELIQATWFISTIEDGIPVRDPELILGIIFAHDLGEDFGITPEKLVDYLKENGIKLSIRTDIFSQSFDAISKYFGKDGKISYHSGEGKYKGEGDYQNGVSENFYASVAKMFDRTHNLMTLVGVRKTKRMHEEIAKTARYYVKNRIDRLSRNFGSHRKMYEMMKYILDRQLEVSRYYTIPDGDLLPEDKEILEWMPKKGFSSVPTGLHPLIVIARRTRAEYAEKYINPDDIGLPGEIT
ncbi:MAG: hypothetical protein KAJ40_07645 [Alphaproteobacteria bacterium]|nr:hypothetical protein [Alphaproteobacteria bacterium]